MCEKKEKFKSTHKLLDEVLSASPDVAIEFNYNELNNKFYVLIYENKLATYSSDKNVTTALRNAILKFEKRRKENGKQRI